MKSYGLRWQEMWLILWHVWIIIIINTANDRWLKWRLTTMTTTIMKLHHQTTTNLQRRPFDGLRFNFSPCRFMHFIVLWHTHTHTRICTMEHIYLNNAANDERKIFYCHITFHSYIVVGVCVSVNVSEFVRKRPLGNDAKTNKP